MDFEIRSKKKSIPHDFVLEQLETLNPLVKPMFGCHAVYVGDKIVVILREKEDYLDDNGVWLATQPQYHESLKKIFPNMRSLGLFGTDKPTAWQNLPSNSDDFEEAVIKACELILANDQRIGKIPQRKIRSKKKSSNSTSKKPKAKKLNRNRANRR